MNTGIGNPIVDPARWDEVGPLLGGYPLYSYEELRRDPDGALPGFYAGERDGEPVLAFQPGWDGIDGGEVPHWYGPGWPSVEQARDRLAGLLVSSWLVQDRDDANKFFPGDEPGSIAAPWGTIPAHVLFAPRKGDDAPWENLAAILAAHA